MKRRHLILILFSFIVAHFSLPARTQNFVGYSLDPLEQKTVETLMSAMTLDEKIGQLSLFMSGWDATGPVMRTDYKALIAEGKVGAVLNGYTVDYVRETQRMAVEGSRLKIPLLFGYDVIHGHRTIFPIPLAQSCSWDLEAIEKSDRIAAIEATAEGLNWTFAPMVDLTRDPRWGRVAEGAGEDTWLASLIAQARVKGFQGQDLKASNTLLACAKHFAAYGAAQAGRDYHTVDMSMLSLREWYLPTYQACVDAGVGSVMTSFNEIAGVPSTANKWLLTELLRQEWGFNGFVVTDWTSINEMVSHGVAANVKDAAGLAINAGVDMDMQGSTFHDYLGELVKEHKVTLGAIDSAVRRILEAKVKLGLFEDPYRYCNNNRQEGEVMTAAHRDFARGLVARSCVLLKNSEEILPVSEKVKKIAVIGPLGNSKKDMLGNWYAAGDPEKAITLYEGLLNRDEVNLEIVYEKGCNVNDTNRGGFDAAVRVARNADFVILALGESGWMSGEASSRSSIGLPGVQDELAVAVVKTGKPVAVVLFNGRPLAITQLASLPVAILEAWFGGTEAGNGIVDVLFGDYNPSGKITISFPRNEGQIPIFYNQKNTGRPYNQVDSGAHYVSRYLDCPNDPLFPFGYGLSFTSFTYADLEAETYGDSIRVSVKVTNRGNREGEEVVQLYVRDRVGTVTRPVKELKGFQKVMFNKGETKTISFLLTKDDLAFYHPDQKKYMEPGEFEFHIGTNSSETLSKTLTVR
jgi:beta-glucosidase